MARPQWFWYRMKLIGRDMPEAEMREFFDKQGTDFFNTQGKVPPRELFFNFRTAKNEATVRTALKKGTFDVAIGRYDILGG